MADQHFDLAPLIARIRQSVETVEWAMQQIPSRWLYESPSHYPPDAWTATMNLAHLVIYEECMSMPVVESIAAGGDGVGSIRSDVETWFLADARALEKAPADELLGRLRKSRERAITILEGVSDLRLNEPATPLWNSGRHGTAPHSIAWVAAKSFQHTWEHGNAILRVLLFAPDP